jgi:hypothetical protein
MAEFIVYICQSCGQPRKGVLELGDALTWEERGARICGKCLDRLCGVAEGAWRPRESSD